MTKIKSDGEYAFRTANIEQLRHIADVADEKEYNRRLPQDILNVLDPEGIAVLEYMLTHKHAAGKPVPDHVRCIAMLCLLDDPDYPLVKQVDVTADDWNALQTAEAALSERLSEVEARLVEGNDDEGEG